MPTGGRLLGSSNLRAFAIGEQLAARGWQVTMLPETLTIAQRQRILRRVRPDVLLIQKARIPPNRPALYPGIPVVFDLDDADWLNPVQASALEQCCRDACAVIAGSRLVADWCRQFSADVTVVWTGADVPADRGPAQTTRAPIVAWASSEPMAYPVEANFIARLIAALAATGQDFSIRIYGIRDDAADGAYLDRLRESGVPVEGIGPLPYAAFLKSLQDVAVGLNPLIALDGFSQGKSFGKVLGYLSAGVPTISHPCVDHPDLFTDGVDGYLRDALDAWTEAARELIDQPTRREAMAQAAFETLRTHLSIGVVTDQVEAVLRRAMAGTPAARVSDLIPAS